MKQTFAARLTGRVSLAAVSLALCAAPAFAADVRGRITDAETKAALPNATVTLAGTSLTTRTAPDGSFILTGAPQGPAKLEVSYVGYPDLSQDVTLADGTPAEIDVALSSADTVSELLVTGQRQAERQALQAKKSANNSVEALYANDVGRLPDQNVSEAVRRLPGVSVANDQGEGRYTIIRGVNPNLANVTLNGQTSAAPEPEGRQVKLDDIPSSLIARVEVIKSLTPDLDANAIAGQVDIATLSAFDRTGTFAFARAAYGQFQLNGEHPYEGDITVGGTFGANKQFGAVVSGNYSFRPIESQNFGASGPSFITLTRTTAPAATYNGPNLLEFRDYNLERKRTGLTANFDFQPTDDLKLYIRTLYSKFSDNETRDRFRIDNPAANSLIVTSDTTGSFTGRGIAYVRHREEDDNTKTIMGGGKMRLMTGELSGEAAWSRAEKVDPIRSEVQFRTGGAALLVNYDISQPLYQFTPDAAFFDPAKYTAFNSVNYDHRKARETLTQGRLDYALPVEAFGNTVDLKFGAKVLDRDKTNERDFQQYGPGSTPMTLASVSPLTDPVTIYDGRYKLGPRIDYDAFQRFVTANPSTLLFSPSGSLANNLVNDYEAAETVSAGYVMGTVRTGNITVIPGVRVEHTEGDYKAKHIKANSTANDPFNTTGDFSYTDYFPGVNVRVDATKNLVVRFAATTAIGRPNFADLAPFVSVDSGTGTASIGNSGLEPLKSVNLDAAVEYYLPGQGILSVGLFRKDIDKPIFTQSRKATAEEVALYGVSATAANAITQPVNLADAQVTGIELNAQSQLTFLPGVWNGFGVGFNVAFTDASASGAPGRAGKAPLSLQSSEVGTAQIYYEKYGFQARLAYSFRSKYLLALGATAADDQWVADYGALDARMSYQFDKKVTAFIEASNLTDEPYQIWVGNSKRVIENERYDTAYRIGLQLAY